MIKTLFGLAMLVLGVGCTTTAGTGGQGGGGGNGPVTAIDSGGDVARGQDTGAGTCPARPDLVVAAPECNSVVNSATAVGFTSTDASAPAPMGGTILDGLYEATRTEGYGTTSGTGRRITFVVVEGATRILWAGEVIAATTAAFRADTRIKTSGTQINFTADCVSTMPSPIPDVLDYTVSGANLVLSLVNGEAVTATTYTRRGCAP
jgi:hypothetical protein